MNDKLISKSFRSMMTLMIFAGVVAMCGSVIDGVVIGNCLSSESMTAFGYASPVFIFLAAIGGVFTNGGKAQCAVFTGKGLYDEAKENFTRAFLLTVFFGILIMVVCLVAAEPIAVLSGASGKFVAPTAGYIRGLAIGAIPIIMLQVMTGYLGLDGAEIYGFLGAVLMSVVNIFLDLMIGLVWHGGLFEMALATSISYLAALLVQLPYFRRKNRLFRLVKFKPQINKSVSLIVAGLPSAVSRVCFCTATVMFNHLLTTCAGEMAVSACSVKNTIGNFVDAIFMGVTGTVSVFSGMFYGERSKNALRSSFKSACKFGMILAFACGIFIFCFAPMLAAGILKTDQVTLSTTISSLRFFAISLPGEIFSQILLYHYLSTEKPKLSNIICVLHNFLFVIIPAWILGSLTGLNGIWFSWFVSGILPLPVMYLFLKKYRSQNKWDLWAAIDLNLESDISESFECSISNDSDSVMNTTQQLREFCDSMNLDSRRSFRICLAVEEMTGNIIKHGFTGKKGGNFIDLRLTLDKNGKGCLSLKDNGVKFNPLEYKNKDTQYGLSIIRGITEKMDYHYIASMNCLNMIIK